MASFIVQVEELIEQHGTEDFIVKALEEFDLTYVEDVPKKRRSWLLARAVALWEEDQ